MPHTRDMNTDTNKAKMLSRCAGFGCRCCQDDTKVRARRAQKRRERQAMMRRIRLMY